MISLSFIFWLTLIAALFAFWWRSEGHLGLRRRYQFEFTSTGEIRNTGQIELFGLKVKALELEAHILPEDDKRAH